MEDEDNKPLVAPDRAPDFVTSYGSAYWWHEMIYIGAHGDKGKLLIEENKLYCIIPRSFGLTQKKPMNPSLMDAYTAWWYETFEQHFFGEEK